MQKIMLNDKYCLTDAALRKQKTMTRRIERGLELLSETNHKFDGEKVILHFEASDKPIIMRSRYKVGEIVAVAQRYSECGSANFDEWEKESDWFQKGFANKMFVKPDLMPHQIQITNIKLERLQDISDEDCIKEGIIKFGGRSDWNFGFYENKWGKIPHLFESERSAFACLIDRVSSKGTWDRNPYVFAYEFKLVK